MKTRCFQIAAIVSCLFCTTVIVFRRATLNHEMSLTYSASAIRYGIRSQGGFISLGRIVFRTTPPPRNPDISTDIILSWRQLDGGHGDVPSALGFDHYSECPGANNLLHNDGVLRFRLFSVAYGPLIAASTVLPLLWVYRLRRRQIRRAARRKAGLCPACGYDLRTSKNRCPECGTPISEVAHR